MPVIPVNDRSMVMPLVGEIDTQRLVVIQSQAFQAIERHRAHTLVLDITGVPLVDLQIAQGLRIPNP